MPTLTRRQFIWSSAAAGSAALGGCAGSLERLAPAPGFPPVPWSWRAEERRLLSGTHAPFELVLRASPRATVLRRIARPVPPGLDLAVVEKRMGLTMKERKGVGLAGPQVGLSLRVATLMLGYRGDHPEVVFVRNPAIVERSDQSLECYEGCLSIPDVGGLVRRSRWVKVQHTTAEGELITREAEGPDAILWQHELDHLDGVLYVDRLQGPLLPMDEVRRRREAQPQVGLDPLDRLELMARAGGPRSTLLL